MFKVLICDKNDSFSHDLKRDVLKILDDKQVQVLLFSDEEQLIFHIAGNTSEANIIIINIKLDQSNGIDVAKKVLMLQPNAQIVFISDSDRYCLDVYSVEHVYFLKKPINYKHLEKALSRSINHICALEKKSLIVSNKEGIHRIFLNEVLFFENERRKIHVHTIHGKISYYGKFEDLMDRLDDRFKRCHNSYIANLSHVRDLCDRKFYYDKNKIVPISKSYYGEVREYFIEFINDGLSKADA